MWDLDHTSISGESGARPGHQGTDEVLGHCEKTEQEYGVMNAERQSHCRKTSAIREFAHFWSSLLAELTMFGSHNSW